MSLDDSSHSGIFHSFEPTTKENPTKPIGLLETPFPQKFGIPRQGNLSSAMGRLSLDKSVVAPGALDGLAVGDFIWLIFQFHQSTPVQKGKIKPPRLAGDSIGIFASRSPHRPNPLGMTLCQIAQIQPKNLFLSVQGVDLVHKTPVLDIKPFVHYADTPIGPTPPHWRHQPPTANLEISVDSSTLQKIEDLRISPKILALARQCIEMDPRPHQQKSKTASYWIQISQFDFCFQCLGKSAQIIDVKAISKDIS